MYNLKERVAIFVDYQSLVYGFHKKTWISQQDLVEIPIVFWKQFNKWAINRFERRTHALAKDIIHMGTWMFGSRPVDRVATKEEIAENKHFRELDNLHGFIIKYSIKPHEETHKGLHVNLVCQMLVGAFEDRYDACILVSDNLEFEPAVHAVQNMYGKRVIHAGFSKELLRAACFGNIALEQIPGFAELQKEMAVHDDNPDT